MRAALVCALLCCCAATRAHAQGGGGGGGDGLGDLGLGNLGLGGDLANIGGSGGNGKCALVATRPTSAACIADSRTTHTHVQTILRT